MVLAQTDFNQLQSNLQGAIAFLQPTAASKVPLAYMNARTDLSPQPKPTLPTLGPAGFQFKDPAFNTSLSRMTDGVIALDANGPNTQISYMTPSDLQLRAWSCDSKMVYHVTTYGTLVFQDFDPSTGLFTPHLGISNPFFSEVDFHPSVPATIVGAVVGDGTILHIGSYNITTKTLSVLLDVGSLLPGVNLFSPRTYMRSVEISKSGTRICAIFGGTGQDLDHYAVVANPDGTGVHILDTLAGTLDGVAVQGITWGWHLHAAWLDQSGRYLSLCPSSTDQTLLHLPPVAYWDIQNNAIVGATGILGGHITTGFGVMINNASGGSATSTPPWDAVQYQLGPFPSGVPQQALVSPVLTPQELYLDSHMSWHNVQPDNFEPFGVSTYRYTFVGGANPPLSVWRPLDDECFLMAPTSGGTKWRMCQHRSNAIYYNAAGPDPTKPNYFWASPRIQVEPMGRWFMFTSNWEDSLGPDSHPDAGGLPRREVFLAGPLS